MKKPYTLTLFFTCLLMASAPQLFAQWCEPLIEPYGPTTPGITHFILNTIDRTSADLENNDDNFTYTGMGTTLQKGQTYSVTISHTVDAPICPDMNLRVWIDYNLDYTFEDAGETVISTDHHAPGSYTASFTVPNTVITGPTRLRVTAKMSNLGGHILPTPCNIPADPLGYHGEMEDYDLTIEEGTGVVEISSTFSNVKIFPNPVSDQVVVSYDLQTNAAISIHLYNVWGERVRTVVPPSAGITGVHQDLVNCSDLADGIYLLAVEDGKEMYTEKISVHH